MCIKVTPLPPPLSSTFPSSSFQASCLTHWSLGARLHSPSGVADRRGRSSVRLPGLGGDWVVHKDGITEEAYLQGGEFLFSFKKWSWTKALPSL